MSRWPGIVILILFSFSILTACNSSKKDDDPDPMVLFSLANSTGLLGDDVSFLSDIESNANLLLNLAVATTADAVEVASLGRQAPPELVRTGALLGAIRDLNSPDPVQSRNALERLAVILTERDNSISISGIEDQASSNFDVTVHGMGTRTETFDYADYLEEAGITGAGSCPISVELADPSTKEGSASVKGTVTNNLTQVSPGKYTGTSSIDATIGMTGYGIYYSDVFSLLKLYEDFQNELANLSSGSACSALQTLVGRINGIQGHSTVNTGGFTVGMSRTLSSETLSSIDLKNTGLSLSLKADLPVTLSDNRELDFDLTIGLSSSINGKPGTYRGSLTLEFQGTLAGESINSVLKVSL